MASTPERVKEQKIDKNNSGEIEQLLNEEYLLKNNEDNGKKCHDKFIYKERKKRRIYENNLRTTE